MAGTFTLFEDTLFRGNRLELELDDFAPNAIHSLAGSRVHDEVSSVQWDLPANHYVALYENHDGTGRSYTLAAGQGADPSTHDGFKDCATAWRWVRSDVAPPIVAGYGWIRTEGREAAFESNGVTAPGGHIQGVSPLDSRTLVISSSGPSARLHVLTWPHRIGDGMGSLTSSHQVAPLPLDHAGGLQACGSIVAVGTESFQARDRSEVQFLDFSSADSPTKLDHLTITRPPEGTAPAPKRWTAGAVGMVRRDSDYLVVVGAWDAAHLELYASTSLNLSDPACRFQPVASWREDNAFKLDWFDSKWAPYQSLSLFRQGSRLFLVGGHAPFFPRKDWLDLYEVRLGIDERFLIRKMGKRHLSCTGGASFLYGGGVYARNGALHSIAVERDFHTRTTFNIFAGPTPPF